MQQYGYNSQMDQNKTTKTQLKPWDHILQQQVDPKKKKKEIQTPTIPSSLTGICTKTESQIYASTISLVESGRLLKELLKEERFIVPAAEHHQISSFNLCRAPAIAEKLAKFEQTSEHRTDAPGATMLGSECKIPFCCTGFKIIVKLALWHTARKGQSYSVYNINKPPTCNILNLSQSTGLGGVGRRE